jgi:hypothetical protein
LHIFCYYLLNLLFDIKQGAQELKSQYARVIFSERRATNRYLFIAFAQRRSGTIPYESFPTLSEKELDDRVRVSNAASPLRILPKKQKTQ